MYYLILLITNLPAPPSQNYPVTPLLPSFQIAVPSPYCLIGSGCEGGVGGGGGGPPEREPRQTGARPTQANCSRPPEHELRRHHRRHRGQSAASCQLFSCQLDRGGHETAANHFKFCVAEESCWFSMFFFIIFDQPNFQWIFLKIYQFVPIKRTLYIKA